uniref:Tc1-like transposase DDE domain-containing protein n=1 Tax=Oncorhynchus tshawytscha TaxID=74940 RepID=A0AAZ3NZI7_ONCTS
MCWFDPTAQAGNRGKKQRTQLSRGKKPSAAGVPEICEITCLWFKPSHLIGTNRMNLGTIADSFIARTMTQHTSRLCKGYLTKKESDGLLHQMTWPPQSPNLNPIEMVWDELDHTVKEKQPTSDQHMWELLQDCWKSIPGEAG